MQYHSKLSRFGLLALTAVFTFSCSLFSHLLPGDNPETRNSSSEQNGRGLIALAGNDGNIYIYDPASQEQTALTRDANLAPDSASAARIYLYPSWSPSTNRLAYMEFKRTPGEASQAVLHTVNSDGKQSVQAFESQDIFPFYLSWSPDGNQVSFLSSAPDQDGLALSVVPAEGGEHRILETGQPFYWDWSPDGRAIVIHTGGAATSNPEARLGILSINERSHLTELDLRPAFFQAPVWSPDGASLVLAIEQGGETALLLSDLDGKRTQALKTIAGPVTFAVSPDGKQLAYAFPGGARPSGPEYTLNVIDLADPQQVTGLTNDPVSAFFWSPDGQQIAYLSPTRESDSNRSIATQDGLFYLGLYTASVASAETRLVVVFQPTPAFSELLPFYDQYQRSTTLWSPDSQALVISALNRAGEPGIYIVSAVQDTDPQRIAEGDLAFWSWK